MVNKTLKTVYEDSLDRSCPYNEYPRPQLKRNSFFTLNGEWDFKMTKETSLPESYEEKILVPFPPESALSGIERGHARGEFLYYRRSFTLPEDFKIDRIILHFGAVDQISTVYINGQEVGSNEGGYLPFSFDVTDFLTKGENDITVRAIDDLLLAYPYGKQRLDRGGMWYTPVSGIWQTVWLESVPKEHIRKIKITPSVSSVKIEVDTDAENKRLVLESGEKFEFVGDSIEFAPSEIKLWTPETPNIYRFTLTAGEDKIESYFAMREISVKDFDGRWRICLNGEPYLFNGLLDQGYYPDGIFLPATQDGYKDDILTAKALGFNMLRKHIKIEPECFYYLCDTLGMAVFQDAVNNSDYSFFRDTLLPTIGLKRLPDKKLHKCKKARRIFTETALKMTEHLYNHPSILYYTVFNEGWGQFSADEVYEKVKKADTTRIIDATSGWFVRRKSDVDSHHVYFKKLRANAPTKRPVVISEFGGYSHRCEGHLFGEENYGYRTFKSREEFEENVKKLYLDEVLPLVKKGVSALVYTQVSDVEDETNGFLTYDRKVLKVNPDAFKEISNLLKEASKENRK